MINGCKVAAAGQLSRQALQRIEEDRISFLRRAMLDYAEHVQATVPKTQKVCRLLKPALTSRLPTVCSRPSPRSTRLMTLWPRVRHGAIIFNIYSPRVMHTWPSNFRFVCIRPRASHCCYSFHRLSPGRGTGPYVAVQPLYDSYVSEHSRVPLTAAGRGPAKYHGCHAAQGVARGPPRYLPPGMPSPSLALSVRLTATGG